MMFSRKKKVPSVDRSQVQEYLNNQVEQADLFARFVCEAVRRKYPVTLKVEVDGVECCTGVILPGGEMLEYLANWACAQSITKKMIAEGFADPNFEGSPVGEPLPTQGQQDDKEGLYTTKEE